jgi:hypothetical protein
LMSDLGLARSMGEAGRQAAAPLTSDYVAAQIEVTSGQASMRIS